MRVSTSLFQAIRSFIVCLLFLSLHQPVTKNKIRNTDLLVLMCVVVAIQGQKNLLVNKNFPLLNNVFALELFALSNVKNLDIISFLF